MAAKALKKKEFPYPGTFYLEVHGQVTEKQCVTKSFKFRLKTETKTRKKTKIFFRGKRVNMIKS